MGLLGMVLAACTPAAEQGANPTGPSRFTGTTGQSDPEAAAKFSPGTQVVCRWRGGRSEYAGVVAQIREGRLFVHYNDGDRENITPSLCRRGTTPAGPAPVVRSAPTTGPSDPTGLTPFRQDDRVACRYRGGPHDFTGTVVGIEDGRLHIHYDDGDEEKITPGLCVLFKRRSDETAAPTPTAAGPEIVEPRAVGPTAVGAKVPN